MRTLLLGLLAIATGVTATGDTVVLHTMGSPQHPVVHPTVVTDAGYRFYDRFCRAQYNNPIDRNACMMRATGTLLPNSERDDR